MRKGLIALLLTLFSFSAGAQSNEVFNAISPNLKQFLNTHPYALVLLTNAVSKASTNRTLELHYFAENKTSPKSFIYFPAESVVHIQLSEKQSPLDEFIGLLFETINSESELLFQQVKAKVKDGKLAQADYATEMLKIEFIAVKITRDLLGKIDLTDQEISNSRFYRAFRRTPDSFEAFLADLQQRRLPERDPIGDYQAEYNRLRTTSN